jgi:cytochrome c oxidase subunit 2
MASVESPVSAPAPGWARPFPSDERIFLRLVLASVVVMAVFTTAWLFVSKHNVPTHFYRTTPTAFMNQVQAFTAKYERKDGLVHVPVGKDGYIMALRFGFMPTLSLQAGHKYRIWLSSLDTLHGFSIVGGGQNINLEIAPNHAFGADITPTKPGKYLIVCNEFCGLGHERMQGYLHVER